MQMLSNDGDVKGVTNWGLKFLSDRVQRLQGLMALPLLWLEEEQEEEDEDEDDG